MKRAMLVPAIALALGACATPETRIRTALTDAGLSKPIAGCMADRMVDRLSLFQQAQWPQEIAEQKGEPDHHRGICETHQGAAGSGDIGCGEFFGRHLRNQKLKR
jgi:hypothetical protein